MLLHFLMQAQDRSREQKVHPAASTTPSCSKVLLHAPPFFLLPIYWTCQHLVLLGAS